MKPENKWKETMNVSIQIEKSDYCIILAAIKAGDYEDIDDFVEKSIQNQIIRFEQHKH